MGFRKRFLCCTLFCGTLFSGALAARTIALLLLLLPLLRYGCLPLRLCCIIEKSIRRSDGTPHLRKTDCCPRFLALQHSEHLGR